MPRVRSILPRLTASAVAVSLSATTFVVTPQVAQANQHPGARLLAQAQVEEVTTFLGLEGEGDEVTALSDALRWELAQRGLDDGRTMTLAELKLTMGCGEEDVPCFAEGGKALETQAMIYGSMTKYGDGFKVELALLDVNTGELRNELSRQLGAAEVGGDALATTAKGLIEELYNPTAEETPEEVPVEETPEEEVVEEPAQEGDLVWGPYSPRPTWKYVGVGAMGALTLASLGTAIGATVAIGPNGPVRRDLLAAAEASLQDNSDSNDIDPNTQGDLCAIALQAPDPNEPNRVINKSVGDVCKRADTIAGVATAGWIATGLFAIGTAAFTTLLFVHKEKPAAAKLLEHDLQLGGAPLLEGGFVLGGSLRF